MTARPRLAPLFTGRDPGHARLAVATAVSLAAMASAALGVTAVNVFHADKAFLSVSLFLSVMSANMVKDRSASARLVTTALMIPIVAAVIAAAVLLSSNRVAVIAVFVGITGAAVWVRRYGPRASAIGSLSFMGYFLALFISPTLDQLPMLLLISAGAIGSQVLARAVLMLKRPRREVVVLLKQLRSASASALHAASHASGHASSHATDRATGHATGHAHRAKDLRDWLARIDEVGRALSDWQQRFPTERYIDCDEQLFSAHVLDARVDMEETCYALARTAGSAGAVPLHVTAHLRTVLDERSTQDAVEAAASWAEGIITQRAGDSGIDLPTFLVARSVIAHVRLRRIDLTHPRTADAVNSEAPESPTAEPQPVARPKLHWVPWSKWLPTSRMTVQVMIAAAVAAGAGELISATHWYWAVMTSFVIFIGATTRSTILTRAYRRVIGTAVGLVIGVIVVSLVGHNNSILVAICLLAIFGMLYFGPLNYGYSVLFLTAMLVSLYSLLGVLDNSLLEMRLIETLVGAVIGVLCAYLIVSSNSRPELKTAVNAYVEALVALLKTVSSSFGSAAHRVEALERLDALERAQSAVDRIVDGMSTAFLISGAQRPTTAVHVMYIVTRSAARLTQTVVAPPTTRGDAEQDAASRAAVQEAIEAVLDSAENARRSLWPSSEQPPHESDDAALMSDLDSRSAQFSPPAMVAIVALARIDWALRRISDDQEREGRRHGSVPSVPLPPA